MSPVSQYVVLIICGLGMLGLILRILGKRRGEVLSKASLLGNSLGICVFGLIFCRTVWCMIQPAVLHIGMRFDEVQAILESQHAEEAGFDLVPSENVRHYWLAAGPAIRIITRPSPTGPVVSKLDVSTYAPKSWKSKGDTERDMFFESFVDVAEYDLKTVPEDCGGVKGDDSVPPGGRQRAAKERFTWNCIFWIIQALVAAIGLALGEMASEAKVRVLFRVLIVAVAVFVLQYIVFSWLFWMLYDLFGLILLAAVLLAFLCFSYATFAFFVAVRLVFRKEHRQMGFWMGCTAFTPIFAILVRGVIY